MIKAPNLASLEYDSAKCTFFSIQAPRILAKVLPRIRGISTLKTLRQLNLDIDLGSRSRPDMIVNVNCVMDLLKAAPFLEELVILVFGGYLSGTNPRWTRNHSGFTNDHLKRVKMHGFRDNWYGELAICILENSPNLEILVIDSVFKFYLGDGKYSKVDHVSYSEEQRKVVEEKLRGVKSDAQIIFSSS